MLIDLGANYRQPDGDGRTVEGEAEKRLLEAASENRQPDPFILEVKRKVQHLSGTVDGEISSRGK